MLIFFIFFIFLVSLSFLHFKFKQFKDNYKLAYFFTFLLMLAAATFRDPSVAVDGGTYRQWFESIPPIIQWLDLNFDNVVIGSAEVSFTIFSGIAKLFSNHVSSLFFIYALISVGSHFYSFNRYLVEGTVANQKKTAYGLVFLAIILYYMNAYIIRDLGQMRFGAACAVGLLAIEPLYKRSHIRFFLITGIAIFLHSTALSLLIPWLLSFTNLIRSRFLIILGIGISVLVGYIGVSDYIVNLIPIQLGYVAEKTVRYSTTQYADEIGLINIVSVVNVAILIVILSLKDRLKNKNLFFETAMLFFISGTYIRFIFNDFGIIAGRLGNLLTSTDVILLPLILLAFNTKSKTLVWSTLSVFALYGLYANLMIRRSGTLEFIGF